MTPTQIEFRGAHREAGSSSGRFDPAPYAGHSLRAGFCTQAYLNGVPELSIMRQSRHQSLDTVRKYIRDRSLFRDNPRRSWDCESGMEQRTVVGARFCGSDGGRRRKLSGRDQKMILRSWQLE